MKRAILAVPLLLAVVPPLAGQAVRSGFTSGGSMARGDDVATSAVPLGFQVNLFGSSFSSAYVSMNGYITFDGPYTEFTPEPLSNHPRKIIAPFFSDVDTRGSGSQLVTWGTGTANNRRAWAANYVGVGYYAAHSDKLNRFQVVLIERSDTGSGNFDIEFNYDSIVWEAGDEDGGRSGLCGSGCIAPTVGYSNGQSGSANVSFQLDGSRVPGAFLDSNPNGLRYRTRNSTVRGRLVFEVRSGVVQVLAISSLSPSSTAAGSPTFTLTVNGSGFATSSVVRWNSTALSTTFVSSGQLRATVPASLVATAGTAQVTVSTPDSGTSQAAPFTISGAAAATLSAINPSSAPAGSGPLTMQVSGANFASGSVVRWTSPAGGADLSTTFRSSTLLEAAVPATLLLSAGTALVSVVSPSGASTTSLPFVVSPGSGAVITSLSPDAAPAGSPSFILTVNGSGFTSNSAVVWNSSPLETFFVNSMQLRATVPSSLLTAPGTAQVTVAAGGVVSRAAPFTISAALGPILAALDPASAQAGSGPLNIQVSGANFVAGSVVRWTTPSGGTDLATSFVSSTLLTAAVPASLLTASGTVQVSVISPTGTASSALPFVVSAAPTAVPVISGLNPASAPAGSPSFTLTITGAGFTVDSIVYWNAIVLRGTYISTTELRVPVPANLVASAGSAQILVVNTATGPSNGVRFEITSTQAPAIASVSPNSAPAGSGALSISVAGRNFASGAVVRWNETALSTTFLSSTDLRASVPASLLATAGTAQITVGNPTGPASNAVAFQVTGAAAPVISSLSPSSVQAGSGAFTLQVRGSNFVNGSVVRWNSTALATTFVSATELRAAVAASLTAAAASAQITVGNPTGPASNVLSFSVAALAAPAISSVSPNSAQAGSGALTLRVTGSNFASGSVVRWSGPAGNADLRTTFVSATILEAAVPASLLTRQGTARVSVANPDGAVSQQVSFTLTAAPPPPPNPSVQVQVTPPSSPTQPAGVRLVFSEPTAVEYQATLALSFEASAAGVPSGYMDPALQFAAGGTSLTITVPRGTTSIPVPTSGVVQIGTVAGNITVRLSRLVSMPGNTPVTTSPPSPSVTLPIPRSAPVITADSVVITDRTATGFVVQVDAYSTPRDLATAVLTFQASGTGTLQGNTSFTVQLTSQSAPWFESAEGRNNGSRFRLRVPFTLSGDSSVLGRVSVVLGNSAGNSAAASSR